MVDGQQTACETPVPKKNSKSKRAISAINLMGDPAILSKADFQSAFIDIGIKSGDLVMVHASMSKFGYIVNGALDILGGLFAVLGDKGTLVVSTNTGQLTDPAGWLNPSPPESHIEKIRKTMRPFDPATTPPRNRGQLVDAFLKFPDVYRSSHPVRSVAARGPLAADLTQTHPLHDPEGEGSPLRKFYDKGGLVLLLGVNFSVCSLMHVAEAIADIPYLYEDNPVAYAVQDNGTAHFVALNKYSEAQGFDRVRNAVKDDITTKALGLSDASTIDGRILVDTAVNILKRDPRAFL